jgi:hypothetical protein
MNTWKKTIISRKKRIGKYKMEQGAGDVGGREPALPVPGFLINGLLLIS